MNDPDRPRLIEDSRGRKKIKISLPGGRYQLSLNDGGVNLLYDQLRYDLRDTVPDTIVKILIATGDAWFPNQKDYESVIAELPETTPLTESARKEVVEFLRSTRVQEARIDTVRDVVKNSSLSDSIDPDEIEVKELPEVPSHIFEEGNSESAETIQPPTQQSPPSPSPTRTPQTAEEVVDELVTETSKGRSVIETRVERLLERDVSLDDTYQTLKRQFGEAGPQPDIFDIPGVGTIRGYNLITADLDSVEELAEVRPIDLTEVTHLDEETATAIVEGARELVGSEEATATQLARQTDEPANDFENALSQLAAAGVPPSAAAPALRELYGPSIVEVPGIDGRMAYFLFEAGYTTPWELSQATVEELEQIDYLGPSTAERVIENAGELIDR